MIVKRCDVGSSSCYPNAGSSNDDCLAHAMGGGISLTPRPSADSSRAQYELWHMFQCQPGIRAAPSKTSPPPTTEAVASAPPLPQRQHRKSEADETDRRTLRQVARSGLDGLTTARRSTRSGRIPTPIRGGWTCVSNRSVHRSAGIIAPSASPLPTGRKSHQVSDKAQPIECFDILAQVLLHVNPKKALRWNPIT